MIVNVGGRTDVVTHYTDWLLNRLEEGYACVRNPLFPHKVSRYRLDPSVVDCIVFGSKDYTPLLPHIDSITNRYGVYCFYTITAYGTDLEPNVPDVDESIETLLALSRAVGPNRVAWRYDPVLLNATYTLDVHIETFSHIAQRLRGAIDRCVFGFVEQRTKISKAIPDLTTLTRERKTDLARELGAIASREGIVLQTCCESGNYEAFGIKQDGCVMLPTLGQANNCQFRLLKHQGTKPKCRCYDNRDIGMYNTCPNGCRYCFAIDSPEDARRNYRDHDPNSPLLVGTIRPDDEVKEAKAESLILHGRQDALPF